MRIEGGDGDVRGKGFNGACAIEVEVDEAEDPVRAGVIGTDREGGARGGGSIGGVHGGTGDAEAERENSIILDFELDDRFVQR